MGKKTSIVLGVVGIVLIVVAIVWWTAIAPSLTKLPSDIDTPMDFEGTLTQYIDPATQQPLPAGQEMAVPFTAKRTFAAVPDLFTSGMGVFSDTIVMTVAGQEQPAQASRYALDRATRKCVESNENWAYSPQIVLNDRVGHYGPLFPGGLDVGDTVSAFFNDPNKAFEVKVVEKIDDFNGLGITALKIDATRPSTAYYPPIQEAVLGGLGLPMEVTFAQLAAQLKAQGLDLEALLTALGSVAGPEDMQALMALMQQPIKLVYMQESGDVLYIEHKTGATVGADFDRTTTMAIDTSGLLGAFTIIGKYATDPTIGPLIAGAMQAAGQLAQAGSMKVFNQSMSIITASQQDLAQQAKDKGAMLDLANLWIPLIILVVGAVLAIVAAFFLLKGRKAPAPARGAAQE